MNPTSTYLSAVDDAVCQYHSLVERLGNGKERIELPDRVSLVPINVFARAGYLRPSERRHGVPGEGLVIGHHLFQVVRGRRAMRVHAVVRLVRGDVPGQVGRTLRKERGEPPQLDKKKKHTIEVVVDRLVIKEGIEKRLADSLETALEVGAGMGATPSGRYGHPGGSSC